MRKVVYTGPLKECGLYSPTTGKTYFAKRGEPFLLDADEDVQAFCERYAGVVKPVEAKRGRKAAAADTE